MEKPSRVGRLVTEISWMKFLQTKPIIQSVSSKRSKYAPCLLSWNLNIYSDENFRLGIPKLSANEKIVMASMFHSMYAIAALQLSGTKNGSKHKPPSSSGIEVLETENFRLNCFQTLTGVKFVVISDLNPSMTTKDVLLRRIYDIYTDFVLKNPFYSLEMPIR